MNKKIIAVFCVVILMASVFTACGNKGYLLAKDENGNEHAYVTDENGETVLNDNGDIRVYETDKNGKIVKDEDGKPKENSVKMPETLITDKKYKTSEFTFIAPNGWKVDGGTFIAVSDDGFAKIQINKFDKPSENFDSVVTEEINMAKKIVEEVKTSNGTAELREGNTKITSNQVDSYYMLFDAEIESNGEKQVLHSCAAYFIFDGNIYKAFYQSTKPETIKIEQVVEVFNNLTMNSTKTDKTNS